MGLICLVKGHRWGHRFRLNENKDAGCKCDICGAIRKEGHDFERCTCKVCGYVRNEEHDWRLSKDRDGKCTLICSVCGETISSKNTKPHRLKGCRCEECGMQFDLGHRFKGCKCEVCGKIRNEGHEDKTLPRAFQTVILGDGGPPFNKITYNKKTVVCKQCSRRVDYDQLYSVVCPECGEIGFSDSVTKSGSDGYAMDVVFKCKKCGFTAQFEYTHDGRDRRGRV